jgi:hypothetical protein
LRLCDEKNIIHKIKNNMKKYLAIIVLASTFTSCAYTNPVEYNDTIVKKIDSLVVYQAAFVDNLGKEGDTTKLAYDKMNLYADKSIASIKKLPAYSDGDDFKNSVLKILNNLKASNVSKASPMIELFKKVNSDGEISHNDYTNIDKLADEYDKAWEDELKKFDEAQKDFVHKTGTKLQKVEIPQK